MVDSTDHLRSLKGRLAAHESWAQTDDRTARTAPARAALLQRFLDEAGGDIQRAESLRKTFYARMAYQSAKARRQKAEARRRIWKAESELAAAEAEMDGAA